MIIKRSFKAFGLGVLFLYIFIHKQDNELIKVEAYFGAVDSIAPFRKVTMNVKITNHSGKVVNLPKNLRLGLKSDSIADFFLEIEQKKSDSIFYPLSMIDERLPSYNKSDFTSLSDGKFLIDSFNIASFKGYNFETGEYRGRVLFRVSKYNKMGDIYSNWASFSIKQSVNPTNRGKRHTN